MSQCHDSYDITDERDIAVARIEIRRGVMPDGLAPTVRRTGLWAVPPVVQAVATLTIKGRQLTGTGEATANGASDADAREPAIGRALVALGSALLHDQRAEPVRPRGQHCGDVDPW